MRARKPGRRVDKFGEPKVIAELKNAGGSFGSTRIGVSRKKQARGASRRRSGEPRNESEAFADIDEWRDVVSSRPGERKYPEPAATIDTICLEVPMVYGEDRVEGFTFREVDESGIGEVHRAIPI